MGKISYGLYIIHIPVRVVIGNTLASHATRLWPKYETLIDWTTPWFCFFFSLSLAVVSFRYYESFFLRLMVEKGNKN